MTDVLIALGDYWDMVRPFVGGVFCLLGGFLALVGAIGVLRFPDFYTRLHAASVTDTGAALALIVGMAVLSPNVFIFIKVLSVGIFLFITAPTSAHAIANAAHTANLEPLTGRFGKSPSDDDGAEA